MTWVLARAMMHIWCEYGECSLNGAGVIALTSSYSLEGQGHDLEDEGRSSIMTGM